MQSHKRSLFESLANIFVGIGVALGSQYLIFPIFGIHISHSAHLGITAYFTAISLCRSYLIRRFFTRKD